ncbi:MAG: molybdopterin cofactor-binding domain-containing protein [Rubrivivax sp.]
MKRRRLIVTALAAGPALLVGWGALPPRSRIGAPESLAAQPGQVALNGWLRVDAQDRVALVMPQSEMGQGVHTTLAMIVAEELRLPLAKVLLERCDFDSRYGNVAGSVESLLFFAPADSQPGAESRVLRATRHVLGKVVRELGLVVTGGSSSIADLYPVLRLAAATARARLLGAASLQWKLPITELQLADGVVSHPSGPRSGIGALAASAAATPAGEVRPTAPADWRLLGTAAPRVDTRAKIDGGARFGIDQRPPGLLYAAIAMPPRLGAEPGALDTDPWLRRPGVLRIVRLPPLAGAPAALAVVARGSWPALKAARELAADASLWRAPPGPAPDGDTIARRLADAAEAAADGDGGFRFRHEGDADAALAQVGRTLQADYRAPYLSHLAMEPLNATAQVVDGRVRLWAPTQAPSAARQAAARVAGVAEDAVELEVSYLGGGFGRRLEVDMVAQAVRVAQETGGAPVQLLWPREADVQHDFYRPAAAARLRAALGPDGRLVALVAGSAGDAVIPRYTERTLPALATRVDVPDKTTAEGLFGWPYATPHVRVTHRATRSGVPVGSWRSVGHSHNAFFAESFADELAHAAGADPLQWRLRHLQALPRHAAVLRLVADAAGWGRALPAGRARGVALHESFGTVVALVLEVSAAGEGVRVHRATAAVDCGLVLNPGIARQQVEGGVLFGLSAALWGAVPIRDGVVQAANFHDQRVLRLAEAPPVAVHVVASTQAPSGLGEPSTPPVAPALANALFALDGRRRRVLPLLA